MNHLANKYAEMVSRSIESELSTVGNVAVLGRDTADLAAMLKNNQLPFLSQHLNGSYYIGTVSKPATPKPKLTLILHIKIASYLGNYGAGKTVGTFTLLPREKTKITIKTYKSVVTNQNNSVGSTDNILDSKTSESVQNLEEIFNQETTYSSMREAKKASSKEEGWEAGMNVAGSFLGGNLKVSAYASGFGNYMKSSEEVTSTSEGLNVFNNVAQSAIDKQVDQSITNRNITVNSTTNTTVTETEENLVERELVNENVSRVLNFVFRQLNQEYVTINYLYDVSIHYTNGYIESQKTCKLDNLEGLLNEVLGGNAETKPERIESVTNKIILHLGNIYNYNQDKISFVERVEQELDPIPGMVNPPPAEHRFFYRKKQGLTDTYNELITVPGIIIGAKQRVLPTDSVIVDALLGQGEALDCYGQKMQEQAVYSVYLDNVVKEKEIEQTEQEINLINSLPTPELKAKYMRLLSLATDCGCDDTKVLGGEFAVVSQGIALFYINALTPGSIFTLDVDIIRNGCDSDVTISLLNPPTGISMVPVVVSGGATTAQLPVIFNTAQIVELPQLTFEARGCSPAVVRTWTTSIFILPRELELTTPNNPITITNLSQTLLTIPVDIQRFGCSDPTFFNVTVQGPLNNPPGTSVVAPPAPFSVQPNVTTVNLDFNLSTLQSGDEFTINVDASACGLNDSLSISLLIQ